MAESSISALLERMRDSAQKLQEDVSPAILSRLTCDFNRFAELVKLFLISERDSYYGYVLMNLGFETVYDKEIIAGIKLDSFPPVFISNPLTLSRFELKEILYIFCHEIDHVVYRHPIEMAAVAKTSGSDASAGCTCRTWVTSSIGRAVDS